MKIKKQDVKRQGKPSLKSLRTRAVRQAWAREKELVLQGKGTRNWTPAQQEELLSRGRVKGFQGHHMLSVRISPRQAGNPKNIQFLTWKEHFFGAHQGSFLRSSNGYYDPDTGKIHTFSRGKIIVPAAVALSAISPVVAAAIKNRAKSESGSKSSSGTSQKTMAGQERTKQSKTGSLSGSKGGTGMINVDEQKYSDMISALNTFASTINDKVGDMMALVQNCCSIMDGDEAIKTAASKMNEVQKAYLEGAKEALSISQAMSQELEEYNRIKEEAAAED